MRRNGVGVIHRNNEGSKELNAVSGVSLSSHKKDFTMLRAAIAFLVIAVIAAILGFGGIAGASAGIAKILALVFLVLFVVSFFLNGRRKL